MKQNDEHLLVWQLLISLNPCSIWISLASQVPPQHLFSLTWTRVTTSPNHGLLSTTHQPWILERDLVEVKDLCSWGLVGGDLFYIYVHQKVEKPDPIYRVLETTQRSTLFLDSLRIPRHLCDMSKGIWTCHVIKWISTNKWNRDTLAHPYLPCANQARHSVVMLVGRVNGSVDTQSLSGRLLSTLRECN